VDTSIIVVIAIVVVFAVAVPAMIRKSATELSRAEIDSVPDNAAVVAAEAPNPGHDHSERTQVFHDKPRSRPAVPAPELSTAEDAPALSLSAPGPELAVIDGHAETATVAETGPVAEADPESQLQTMPVAVGQTRTAFSAEFAATDHATTVDAATGRGGGSHGTGGHGQSTAGNVRMLHPAVHAVFDDSSRPAGQSGSGRPTGQHGVGQYGGDPGRQSRPAHGLPVLARSAGDDPRATSARGGAPRTVQPGTSRGGHLGEGDPRPGGPLNSNPNLGADEEHAMTEQATTLRESLKSLGTMTRGFALVLLASVLGVVVTSVLALFSVVHIALAGVFLGLGVVSLLIVRTLNLRRREVRKRLRRLEHRPKPEAKPRTAPVQQRRAPTAERTAPARTSSRTHTGRASGSNAAAQPAPTSSSAPTAAPTSSPAPTAAPTSSPAPTSAPTSSGTAARIAAAARGRNGTTKAAQARAVMARSTEAKRAREEADTGEIPLVRIRKEATEGHTTRQVLLTGPIPAVEEGTPADSADDTTDRRREKAGSAEKSLSAETTAATEVTAAEEAAAADQAAETSAAPVSLGSDLPDEADTAATDSDDADVRAALDAAAPKVDDPFMQRLKSRDGWSPTPLPVPSYVDAPEAEHPAPSATAADASSYETEARSREDIAAQFAAELGYRPELSDSAREEGPLEHGRKAIRTTKAADLGAVNDVLARRRA
jgi:hypothetical protein